MTKRTNTLPFFSPPLHRSMVLSEDEVFIIKSAISVSSSISILGCSFVCLNYLIFSSIRTYTSTLICMLSVTQLLSAIMNLLVWSDSKVACFVQAIGLQYFDVSSFLWTSCIAFHAFQIIYKKQSDSVVSSYFKYYLIVCFGIPLLLVLAPLLYNNPYENDVVWCWISEERRFLRLLVYYLPLILLWLFNLAIYIILRAEMIKILSFMMASANRRMSMYILIFIICKFPGLMNRIYSALEPGEEYQLFWLFFLQAVFGPLQGFCNSVVYGMNKTLRHEYSHLTCTCCGCCCHRDTAYYTKHDSSNNTGTYNSSNNSNSNSNSSDNMSLYGFYPAQAETSSVLVASSNGSNHTPKNYRSFS